MNDETIKKDLVQNFLDIYLSEFGINGFFKSFWDGDPISISEADLPALIIDEVTTNYSEGATQSDDVDHQILIQVALNKKLFIGEKTKPGGIRKSIASRELRQIVHGRNPVNSQLMPKTILGILRSKITLGLDKNGGPGESFTVNNKVEITFGVVGRPGNVVTAEAQIRVNVNEFLYVMNRS